MIGYTAVVDQERLDKEYVEAYIELRVTPQRDHGFEEIATRVAAYDEVKDVYLMSRRGKNAGRADSGNSAVL